MFPFTYVQFFTTLHTFIPSIGKMPRSMYIPITCPTNPVIKTIPKNILLKSPASVKYLLRPNIKGAKRNLHKKD